MRMRRSRVKIYYLKSKGIEKDCEGNTEIVYSEPVEFQGEVWPAEGKLQAEMYGEKLSYMRNVRIDGKYAIETDNLGIQHYIYPNGLDVTEGAGLCIYVSKEEEPDYKVIAIKSYNPLLMECERL